MENNEDVREYLRKFFDTVDKLTDMEVDINLDLLTVMLLYSLPSCYENFWCAIERATNFRHRKCYTLK